MLERGTGCLEHGSVRRLVAAIPQSKQSRRHLHRVLLSHDAEDVDNNPLHAYRIHDDGWSNSRSTPERGGKSAGSFLDFLYPTAALSILRFHTTTGVAFAPTRGRVIKTPRRELRTLVTSSHASPQSKPDPSRTEKVGGESPKLIEPTDQQSLMSELDALLAGESQDSYEAVWRKHIELQLAGHAGRPKDVMAYLSDSAQIVNSERVTDIFRKMRRTEWDGLVYNLVVRAYLRLHDVRKAIDLHRSASLEGFEEAGAAELLRYLVSKHRWLEAYSVWSAMVEARYNHPLEQDAIYDLRRDWIASPELAGHVRCLILMLESYEPTMEAKVMPKVNTSQGSVTHPRETDTSGFKHLGVNASSQDSCGESPPEFKMLEENVTLSIQPSKDRYPTARSQSREMTESLVLRDQPLFKQFVGQLVLAALLEQHSFDETDFLYFYNVLHQTLDIRDRENSILAYLMKHCQNRFTIIRHYRKVRKQAVRVSSKILLDLLDLFCKLESRIGIQEVLEDLTKAGRPVPRRGYFNTMSFFARQGDIEAVDALYAQYLPRYGPPRNTRFGADDFAPLLKVHAQRGDVDKVLACFKEIQTSWGYEPSCICWNILISAYGKVQDIDAAFETFQALLDAGVKPSRVTFGTLMSIVSTRGDRHTTLQLWELSTKLGVKPGMSMISALVHVYIHDGMLEAAENLCERVATGDFAGSKSLPWNTLVLAYALRLDLSNCIRIVRRMATLKITQDEMTFAAVIQAVGTAEMSSGMDRIFNLLPEAGIRTTAFHYAVMMGVHLSWWQNYKVLRLQKRMVQDAGLQPTLSTKLLGLSAATSRVAQTRLVRSLKEKNVRYPFQSSDEDGSMRRFAIDVFEDLIDSIDPMHLASSPRKGLQGSPLDRAYQVACFRIMMKFFLRMKEIPAVRRLQKRYEAMMGSHMSDTNLMRTLFAAKVDGGDPPDEIETFWQDIVMQARKDGAPVVLPTSIAPGTSVTPTEQARVLFAHRGKVNIPFSYYMKFLEGQNRVDDITPTKAALESYGFTLDVVSWNQYVQVLARHGRWKAAFENCEQFLMSTFIGWEFARRDIPGAKKHTPRPVRLQADWRRGINRPLRVMHKTMLWLARLWSDMQSGAVEDPEMARGMQWVRQHCQRTLEAMRSMPRSPDDERERRIMGEEDT